MLFLEFVCCEGNTSQFYHHFKIIVGKVKAVALLANGVGFTASCTNKHIGCGEREREAEAPKLVCHCNLI